MAKKALAIAVLLLRIFTFAFLLASLIILATDTVKDPDSGEKATFQTFYAYRYVLSVDAIGGVYMLVQILLSVITFTTRSYSDNKLLVWFGLFFDLVFALFFATGVGAGFGLTVDTKKQFDGTILNVLIPGVDNYFNLVYVSSAFLLMAAKTMAAIILCSAYAIARK